MTIQSLLATHSKILSNISRSDLIDEVLEERNAFPTKEGNLFTWSPNNSAGRSPKDTYIVKHSETADTIDWTAPSNLALEPAVFDELMDSALEILASRKKVYELDRTIGADSSYALPVKLITDSPLSALFADNMFRAVPDEISQSVLADKSFTLIVVPYEKIKSTNYDSEMTIAMDFDRKIGLVYGSWYCGSIKKLMFTAMNYYTPEKGILPLHCAANEGNDGSSAVILGLSGTGKTTLSADERRPLLGDDEHGWSGNGVANFENGCYAKLIDLNPEKEPEIYRIAFGEKKDLHDSGVIIENTMIYPNGQFDLFDSRLSQNSRVSYPLTSLKNAKESSKSGHPKTILFLTADANGVLPPVSKLNDVQAMLWFLMGYTSKLAGTETGITEPKSAFSRFFGGPFMPRNPQDYTELLNKKIVQHDTNVYLVNTGWTGGPYGIGKRFDIAVTRRIVDACLNGELENVEYRTDERFHISVPMSCPDIDSLLLDPQNTWTDKDAYTQRADKLANDFAEFFDKNFSHVSELAKVCPGK